MEESTLVADLIRAGIGGLVIIVVVLFLKFLTAEREKSNEQHERMMDFIKEQREANNAAVVKAADVLSVATARSDDQSASTYIQVADAVKGMATEIRLLREGHLVHDTTMTVALDNMRKAKAATEKKKAT